MDTKDKLAANIAYKEKTSSMEGIEAPSIFH
jgi:hypothetical protein